MARAGRCTGGARAILAGLAVAGRPLTEELLGAVTGLGAEAVRGGLRELADARLLAEDTAGGGCRPRHALLAEAVVGGLLPGERAVLHERTARALVAAGDEALAGEVAGHWQAAGCPAEELTARVAAAEAAERVFGYAEAAAHWQRAIELCQAQPGTADAPGADVPGLYLRAIDALEWSGNEVHAGVVAEEAYRRFADHSYPATAAAVCRRAARYRAIDAPVAGLALIEEALRLFEQAPPSADHAKAWLDYADICQRSVGGGLEGIRPALNRALGIAEAASASALIPHVLARIAGDTFGRGRVEEGFAFLERGWALARAADAGVALARLAEIESDALLKLARFELAADVAVTGLESARQAGLEASRGATILAFNACEALLASGRTAEAAALIDPLTARPPDRDHWPVHEARAELDLLRGDTGAAARRWRLIDAIPALFSGVEYARESAQRAAELALWAGRPGDALGEVQRVLPLFKFPDLTIFGGRLLVAGLRACADLAEQARARRDEAAIETARAAADGLTSWVSQMAGAPFTDHPFVATIPAERATWDAERARLAGACDPEAWRAAAKTWEGLGCPHRAGYAWWRQAQAQLDCGQPATAAAAALRSAAAAADGHAPLLAHVRRLAERARIPLQPLAAGTPKAPPPAQARAPFGLTGRELAVLRLLAAGAPTRRSGRSFTSAPAPPACTSPASCGSWGSPAGCRPPRWLNGPACCRPATLRPVRGNLSTRGPRSCAITRSAPPGLSRILGTKPSYTTEEAAMFRYTFVQAWARPGSRTCTTKPSAMRWPAAPPGQAANRPHVARLAPGRPGRSGAAKELSARTPRWPGHGPPQHRHRKGPRLAAVPQVAKVRIMSSQDFGFIPGGPNDYRRGPLLLACG